MKRLILSIFAFFCAVSASAQEHQSILINRIDEQMAVVNSTPLSKVDESNGIGNSAPLEETKAISFSLKEGSRIKLIAGKDVIIEGVIKKHIAGELPINFERTHIRLPFGWTSSICFGTTCYSPKVDSLPYDSPYIIPETDSIADFSLHLVSKAGADDSVMNYIKIFAQTGNPADTIALTFVGVLETLGVEQQTNPVSSQPKILSLYPSPLIDGNSIKVKVNAPKEMTFSYTISDELGRSVAFGTTYQRLSQGDNTYQISELAGLTNGSYLLKITFGDGSIDTRSFQVIH